MNVKNFIVGGIVGGIVDFFLGWILWGMLFVKFLPPSDESKMNFPFIFLGCMSFAFFMSYIFSKWAGINNTMSGMKSGAVFGLFISLFNNFFYHSSNLDPNYSHIIVDVLLTIFCGGVVGAVIAFVNRKM